jgi:hypothetical protein
LRIAVGEVSTWAEAHIELEVKNNTCMIGYVLSTILAWGAAASLLVHLQIRWAHEYRRTILVLLFNKKFSPQDLQDPDVQQILV